MQGNGVLFDGETAADRPVLVKLEAEGLTVWSGTLRPQTWRFGETTAVDKPSAGHPLRLANLSRPGARLILRERELVEAVLARAPHLHGGINLARSARIATWIAGGIAVVAAMAYVVLQLAPQQLAAMLPDSWRDKVGAQIETTMTEGAATCDQAGGRAALTTMVQRLSEGVGGMPTLAVKVYDMPVMNAFAMPGGRIILTRELIARAETPEEVAGVLAHEIGHVAHRHSEAQLVRAVGLQLLLSLATGGSGNSTLTSVAGVAAILRFSRSAESEADEFALSALQRAEIDPLGLKQFFERVLKEENKNPGGALGQIEGAFATHPGTEERIAHIHPLPEGTPARPVLDAAQWQSLKAICKTP